MEVEEPMSVGEIDLDNVVKIVEKPMCKGESWHLVDAKWYEQFLKFLNDKEPEQNPGPIDNTKLFIKPNGDGLLELKYELEEEVDYKFVPEEAWKTLLDYFGIKRKNHEIKRWVIEEGVNTKCCVVEVYLTEVKVCLYGGKLTSPVVKLYSRVKTLYDLEEDMRTVLGVDSSQETRIRHLDQTLDTSDGKTLADVSISSGDDVILEVRSKNGTWPSAQSRSTVTRSSTNGRSHSAGLCGLSNLGNTCFMNSALQCLSNTPPLTEFIMSDRYLNEINRNNPLGMEGRIAEAYGEMIKNMWSGNMNCLTPRDFKFVVGNFAPQFSGYQQQDSQELMAFLLDGLHEDFNRITKKPYIESKTEVDRRPEHIVAQESWDNYKKRNDSIIEDTFHGLLKSTLVCPDCQNVSVTFDPFCYLSLPLPTKREKQIDVVFVPATTPSADTNGNNDMENESETAFVFSGLSVPKYGTMSEISKALAPAIDKEKLVDRKIDPHKLIVTEVFGHRLQQIYENEAQMSVHMSNLVVYEMPLDGFTVPVHLREVSPDGTKTLFGRPFFIGVNAPQYHAIYESVANHLNNYLKTNCGDDDDDGSEHQKNEMSFTLALTNSLGTFDIDQLDATKPIQFNSNSFLAVDMLTTTKAKYYDERRETPLKIVKSLNQQKSSIQLSDCINNFTTTEKLCVNDSWYCPSCKKHQQATKKFDLWQLPKVLIIHLKRFSYSRHWRDKLDTLVNFPTTGLDIGNHVIYNPDKKPILYDLIAVSNHSGGLGGGHYTASAKNSETKKWYYFNDSSVNETSEKEVVSKQGYVLYYLKRSED